MIINLFLLLKKKKPKTAVFGCIEYKVIYKLIIWFGT